MNSPIENMAGLVVGTVDSVAPDQIRVSLEADAPQTTALNAGTPVAFPRINGYVLIPNELGATVAYIAWIGVEASSYLKRSGFKDSGLVDLPFPVRKMNVLPVGTLTTTADDEFEMERGVLSFPFVGDQVLVPTPLQLESIVGSRRDDRRVRIGSSPMSANAEIRVDPDKLFGRHLAVLGNTGSGKSCSVAGLIRWSMEAAKNQIAESGGVPNARFIILDPNGEYAGAFADQQEYTRLFRVPPVVGRESPLSVPAWMWNGAEWTAISHAQPGVQRPLLLQGLRELKSGQIHEAPREVLVRRYLQSYSARIASKLGEGTQGFAGSHPARFDCARLLGSIAEDCALFCSDIENAEIGAKIQAVADRAAEVVEERRSGSSIYFDDFSIGDLESVKSLLGELVDQLPGSDTSPGVTEDAPIYFDVTSLPEHLDATADEQGGNVSGFISTLGLRLRSMLADPRLSSVIGDSFVPTQLDDWLNDYVGSSEATDGQIAIIDLSLVPTELVHVVVAVLGRIVFEALQRYRRLEPNGMTLPTVLVLEEAHVFVRKGFEDSESSATPAKLCRETFERVAREGRKFGLGLVLSSQRPSELSPTILAQCNTFLLHRIVNDVDQNLVARLVPDSVGGILRELPSLPSRQAILLGWATLLPVLVEIDQLPDHQRPQSADPDFWDVWTLEAERTVDWAAVVSDWNVSAPEPSGSDPLSD